MKARISRILLINTLCTAIGPLLAWDLWWALDIISKLRK